MLASAIMDGAAAVLNDRTKEVYSYEVQLEYLRMALRELKEEFQLNNVPITNETSAVISLPTNTNIISFDTIPALPPDFVQIQNLWESEESQDSWVEIRVRDFLPPSSGLTNSMFSIYVWQGNQIKLRPINKPKDIKIDYIRNLFTDVVDENSEINITNGESYLMNRTGALVAEFVAEDEARASKLNGYASVGMTRATGIEVKSTQGEPVRRRHFRRR